MKAIHLMVGLMGVLLLAGCASVPTADVGSNGIAPVAYRGWHRAFRLENATATVVVVPAIGRMMHLGVRDGANILRNDPHLLGQAPREASTWTNFGGDWIWPVAQSRWAGHNDSMKNGLPPKALHDGAWDACAWREPDGRQSCLLIRYLGHPVNAVVMRQFTLDAGKPRVTVQQRMVATADSEVPLTLWSIMQIDKPQLVFFPVRASSRFDKGYELLAGEAPPGPMKDCNEIMACELIGEGSSRIGVDAAEPWIAARKYDVAVVVRASNPFSGELPDGGCSIQAYSAGRNVYAQIETLSPEFHLRAGESLGNALTIELMSCHPGISPCRLAEMLRPEEK